MKREEQWSRCQGYLVRLADVAKCFDADHPHHDTGDEIRLSGEAHGVRLSLSFAYSLRVRIGSPNPLPRRVSYSRKSVNLLLRDG
jgi:hypothetical protein